MACALPPPGGGGKRGRDTKVSLPLLTPQPFLWTRLPSVARLKARDPQGRLVLQGYTIDRSGAGRSANRTLCTGWPRTVMRGTLRKGNSGHNSVPKSARRTEPSPRNPRFAAHLRCVSAKRKVWGVKRGQETILGVLSPFVSAVRRRQFLPPVGTGNPRRPPPTISPPPDGGNFPESFIKALPEQRPCAPATGSAFRSFAARSLLRVPVRRSTAPPCARW